MSRKNSAHDIVVESISEALILLMKKKPYREINVSELCSRAGVSRISFYRNFTSLDDILIKYLTRETDEWWIKFTNDKSMNIVRNFWPELMKEYKKNEELVLLLYKNNATNIIKEHIFVACGPKPIYTEERNYLLAAVAGSIYGVVEEWIRQGMKEIPKGFSVLQVQMELSKEYEAALEATNND